MSDNPSTRCRRQLFQLFSRNLSLHNPELAGQFACPICGCLHQESGVEPEALTVDIAHTYPRRLGRSPETLTCKSCNSRLGTQADSHIVREHMLGAALDGSGDETIDARISVTPGGTMGATVRREGDHLHFVEIEKQTNPTDRDSIIGSFGADQPWKMQLRAKAFDPQGRDVGLLHSAYLTMFRHFGYEYYYGADTQWIRAVLTAEPVGAKAADVRIVEIPATPKIPPFFKPMVLLINARVICVAVALPPPRRQVEYRLILLPGFGISGANDYDRLRAEPFDGKINIGFVSLEPADDSHLVDPARLNFGQVGWEARRALLLSGNA